MSRITTTVLLTTTLASLTLTAQGPASAAAAGPAGNAASQNPAISKTGRFVVFDSDATNLVAGDTNAKTDVFIRDTVAKTTKRVSVSATGAQGTGASYRPSVSDDGRYVAFISAAANLVPGDTNGKPDAFRKDVVTGQIVRLSTALGGAQGNAETQQVFIDGTGTKAAFTSAASNLVAGDTHPGIDVFVRDVAEYKQNFAAQASGQKVRCEKYVKQRLRVWLGASPRRNL